MEKFRKVVAKETRDVGIKEVNFKKGLTPEKDFDCWRLEEEGFLGRENGIMEVRKELSFS